MLNGACVEERKMSKMIIYEKLIEDIKGYVEDVTGSVMIPLDYNIKKNGMSRVDIIHMVAHYEEKFEIVLTHDEYGEWNTVEDIVDTLCESLIEAGYIVIGQENIEKI